MTLTMQRRAKGTVATNIVTDDKTFIYTSFYENGVLKRQFMLVRDLINDIRDPSVFTMDAEGRHSDWATFIPMSVTAENPRSFLEVMYMLSAPNSRRQLQSVIIGRNHVITPDGKQTISTLVKNGNEGRFSMAIYDFVKMEVRFETVLAERVSLRTEVTVDADSNSYHRAYPFVILGDGLIVSR